MLEEDQGKYFLATGFAGPTHLFKSTDLEHWSDITPPEVLRIDAAEPGFGAFEQVNSVSFASAQAGIVVACDESTNRASAFRTTDGGSSWTAINIPAAGSTECGESVQMLSPSLAMFLQPEDLGGVGGTVVWRSTDDGSTWQPVFTVQTGRTGPAITPVIYSDPQHAFSATGLQSSQFGPSAYFQSSTDGGATWTTTTPPNPGGRDIQYSLPVPVGPQAAVLASLGQTGPSATLQFDTTTTDGSTWQPAGQLIVGSIAAPASATQASVYYETYPAISVASHQVWWVSDPAPATQPAQPPAISSMHITTNGGKAWVTVTPKGLPGNPSRLVAVNDRDAVALVGRPGSPGPVPADLYETLDGGSDWTPIALPTPSRPSP